MEIRNATLADFAAIVALQNVYITSGFSGIFRDQPFTIEERLPWFEQFQTTGPYQLLVAEEMGSIRGLACSFSYRDGGVFHRTVETSIYTDPDQKSKGVGSMLYDELFGHLNLAGLHLAVAGIALPNDRSIALHRKFGFEDVGVFKEYAYFQGNYISSLWMQKTLGT